MARDSARACGCDPKEDHVCEGHANHVDESETAIAGAIDNSQHWKERNPLIIVVTGPDRDGEFGLLAADCVYMTRFVVEDLIAELQRRLRERA